ncbi:MAG: GNAT family N-acetyltransferase [Acidimicrobiia bacterium]
MSDLEHPLTIRPSREADLPAVLALLEASMGWLPDDLHARFFTWKHAENPFGPSPAWVAVDEADGCHIVGYRTFLRWEFARHGQRLRAVRAVDTATHPDYQGRGVFSRLTLAAIDDLRARGHAFVFNTPNERSLPGYLKMGWRTVGRLPVEMRPRSAGSLARLLRARTAAEKWSLPCDAGLAAADAFGNRAATTELLGTLESPHGLVTHRSAEFLAWRYGFGLLGYRVLLAGRELEDGAIVFRLRRRGTATEAAITDQLVPGADRRLSASLARRVLRESGADYAVRLRTETRAGFVPLPRQGPVLVYRPLADAAEPPPQRDWALALGDVELF